MPIFTDPNTGMKAVRLDNGITVWDAITKPETTDEGALRYSLKFVLPPNSPDIQDMERLEQEVLVNCPFQGHYPNGANKPIGTASPNDYEGNFPGYRIINAITYKTPIVYDEQGKVLQPMQFSPLMYTGQCVSVLVTCQYYNNKSRGIKCQLEAFSINASRNAPRLSFGSASFDATAAFGHPQQGGQPPQPPQYGQHPQPPQYGQPPHPSQYVQPGGQPPQQGGQPPHPSQYVQPGQPPQSGYLPNANFDSDTSF